MSFDVCFSLFVERRGLGGLTIRLTELRWKRAKPELIETTDHGHGRPKSDRPLRPPRPRAPEPRSPREPTEIAQGADRFQETDVTGGDGRDGEGI